MRIRDIIVEDALDEIIEDEAADPAIVYLEEILMNAQGRSHNFHQVPKLRLDSLINLVKIEHPEFDMAAFDTAKQNNETVKNLVKSVDTDKNGVMYVYITPYAEDITDKSTMGPDGTAPKTAPEKTVDAMAKSALAKRG